jgi:predicted secreted hydrolase
VRGRTIDAPLLGLAAMTLAAATLLAGCSSSGLVLANPVPSDVPFAPPSPTAAPLPDPQPIVFPRDDGPHQRLTEWWYDTGHLAASDGRRFGFEMVIFRAERGDFPVGWASHLAITDESGRRFVYDQRSEIGPQVDHTQPDGGFDLAIAGQLLPGVAMPGVVPWTMRGVGGADHLVAQGVSAGSKVPFGLDLTLDPAGRSPVLHNGVGYVDFGPGGGSYYYSRPRLDATGTITLDGEVIPVTGQAWFDHQWGDFIAVGNGGWDWFAVNLDDGTDLMVSLVRSADGIVPLVYGTQVGPDGTFRPVARDEITVSALDHWTSVRTGTTYPSGWRVRVSGAALDLLVVPTVRDQELDTRATTGVAYWEGSQRVSGTLAGRPVTGRAYVELTGYAGDAASTP